MLNQLPGEIGGAMQSTVNGRELHEAIRYSVGSYLGFVEERIEALGLVENVEYSVTVDDIAIDYVFTATAANRMMRALGSEPAPDVPPRAGVPATGDNVAQKSHPKRKAKPVKPGAPVVSLLSGHKVDPRQLEMVF